MLQSKLPGSSSTIICIPEHGPRESIGSSRRIGYQSTAAMDEQGDAVCAGSK
jgi:hypothetical protein